MSRTTSAGEILQSRGQALRLLREDIAAGIRNALPGIIQAYDKTRQTAVIQPAIMEALGEKTQPLPVLHDVPVFFLGSSKGALTFAIAPGDECLVVFADTAVDAWKNWGRVQGAVTPRRHSLSDGFALVGFRSAPNKLPDSGDEILAFRVKSGTGWAVVLYVDSLGNLRVKSNAHFEQSVGIEGDLLLGPEAISVLDWMEEIDTRIGHHVDITATRDVLTLENPTVTLTAHVWDGDTEITSAAEMTAQGMHIVWRKASDSSWSRQQGTGATWNQMTVSASEVSYSETYYVDLHRVELDETEG